MQAVIMAGGFGTRLRPLTCNIPKPMIPLVNKPIMEHVINLLKSHSITDIIVLLYFQSEKITSYFKDGKEFGVKISYIKPESDFGTAGAVRCASHLLKERFIVISGDLATDFDLRKSVDFHDKNKGDLTLLLKSVENPLQYGVVIIDEKNRITQFLEKPTWGEVFSDLINTGIYIIEPEILKNIPQNEEYDFSKNLFPLLLNKGANLLGYEASGYWIDVGNLNDYLKAHYDALTGSFKVQFSGRNEKNYFIGKNTHIHTDAIIEGKALFSDQCTVGKNSIIRNSFIGYNTKIGKNSKIYNSIIWDNVEIGDNVTISGDVITSKTKIKDHAYLFEKVFIGENCKIEENARIKANVKIWPDKVVEKDAVLSSSLIWGERWVSDIFSEARVTGIGNFELSPEFSLKLATAFGAMLGEGSTVVTSRDSDPASRMIKRAMISGFMSSGVNVEDLQYTPIPLVRYHLRSGQFKGGIHVRSSPRGEKLYDIIFFDAGGRDIPPSRRKGIERLFFNEDFRRAEAGNIGRINYSTRAAESYLDHFFSRLDTEVFKKKKFRAVIDYSYGAATSILPSALGKLGIEVISLGSYADSTKIVKERDFDSKSFKELSHIVKSLHADCGITVGPIAESFYLIDNKGRIIKNSELLVLMTELFLRCNTPKKIATPVNGSFMVDEIAQNRNVEVLRCKSSHEAMMEMALKDDISFVGGTRGGFIFSGFHFASDALFAVAKLIEMLLKTGIPVSDIYNEFHFPYMIEKVVRCGMEYKGKVMRGLMKETESYNRVLVDGIKIIKEMQTLLIIPHKAKPQFSIIGESYNKQEIQNEIRTWEKKIKTIRDSK